MTAPSTRQTLRPRNWQAASTIMLTPMAQITCRNSQVLPPNCSMPPGAKLIAVDITNHSTKISHRPRVSRNCASSAGVLRATISPALVPARNTNTGAQKCVIQRVKRQRRADIRIAHRILHRAVHEEVAHVIERHDDDDQATQHVDGCQAIAALIGHASSRLHSGGY